MRLFRKRDGEPGEVSPDFDPAACFCGCGREVPEHLQIANRTGAELWVELQVWQGIELAYYGRDVEVSPLDTESESGRAEGERIATPEAERPNASGSDTLRFHMRSSLHFLQDAIHRGYTPDDSDAKFWLREGRTLRRKHYAQ
jgi:hypothetical protein